MKYMVVIEKGETGFGAHVPMCLICRVALPRVKHVKKFWNL
jgi:hypothetical protein